MNELLKQTLIDKSARRQVAARRIAHNVPTGAAWN
jgi:hypothetical protein